MLHIVAFPRCLPLTLIVPHESKLTLVVVRMVQAWQFVLDPFSRADRNSTGPLYTASNGPVLDPHGPCKGPLYLQQMETIYIN